MGSGGPQAPWWDRPPQWASPLAFLRSAPTPRRRRRGRGREPVKDKINLNLSLNTSLIPQNSIIAKGDSGASRHCFSTSSSKILTDIGPAPTTPIILPNNQEISAHATAHIPIPQFSKNATKTYLLQELKNTNLISLGQLCDDGCYVLLTQKKLYVCKNKNILLQGYRNTLDRLWDSILPKSHSIQKTPIKNQYN